MAKFLVLIGTAIVATSAAEVESGCTFRETCLATEVQKSFPKPRYTVQRQVRLFPGGLRQHRALPQSVSGRAPFSLSGTLHLAANRLDKGSRKDDRQTTQDD